MTFRIIVGGNSTLTPIRWRRRNDFDDGGFCERLLWILAGITAAAFLMAGTMKLMTPRDKLKEMMAWVGDVSPGLVKFMGTAEILGGWV